MYCVPNLCILQWNILLKANNRKRMRNSKKKLSVKHKCPPLIRSVFLEKVQDALRYFKKCGPSYFYMKWCYIKLKIC